MTLTVRTIQELVAAEFNVSVFDIKSSRRARNIVRPRQAAMYLARRHTLRTLPEIGYHFGDRDHTTVIHAIRVIEKLRADNADLDQGIRAVERRIAAGSEPLTDETRERRIAASYGCGA